MTVRLALELEVSGRGLCMQQQCKEQILHNGLLLVAPFLAFASRQANSYDLTSCAQALHTH